MMTYTSYPREPEQRFRVASRIRHYHCPTLIGLSPSNFPPACFLKKKKMLSKNEFRLFREKLSPFCPFWFHSALPLLISFYRAYYEFDVGEGDVLLFNNSACIHKFMNLTENPEIFTMRLFTTDASPLTLRNDLFNWTGAKYFTGILMDGGTHARNTDSV